MFGKPKTFVMEFEYRVPEKDQDVSAIAQLFRRRQFILPRTWIFASVLLEMQKKGSLQYDGHYRLITVVHKRKYFSELHRRIG